MTGILLTLYVAGSFIAFLLWAHDEISSDEAFWWPLVLLKFAVKSLFRVLMTGWRA